MLYLSPTVLRARMEGSGKNRNYLQYDIEAWQDREIAGLRQYCHEHDKDFYVLDNPPEDVFGDISDVIGFIREIGEGYSCVSFAVRCVEEILGRSGTDTVTLLDGDRTLAVEDSSKAVFGYRTHVFDGEFYTGYQVWKQNREFEGYPVPELKEMPVRLNERIVDGIAGDAFLLTSGHERIWRFIAGELQIPFYGGREMAAETKFFIAKMLQKKYPPAQHRHNRSLLRLKLPALPYLRPQRPSQLPMGFHQPRPTDPRVGFRHGNQSVDFLWGRIRLCGCFICCEADCLSLALRRG